MGQTGSCYANGVPAKVRHEALIRDKPNTAGTSKALLPGCGAGQSPCRLSKQCLPVPKAHGDPFAKARETKLAVHLRLGLHAAEFPLTFCKRLNE